MIFDREFIIFGLKVDTLLGIALGIKCYSNSYSLWDENYIRFIASILMAILTWSLTKLWE